MVIEMVRTSGVVTHEVDDSWPLRREEQQRSVSVVIVPELFKTTDSKCLTGVGPKATTVYIRSGIPLAKITSGTNKDMYGPYDKTFRWPSDRDRWIVGVRSGREHHAGWLGCR